MTIQERQQSLLGALRPFEPIHARGQLVDFAFNGVDQVGVDGRWLILGIVRRERQRLRLLAQLGSADMSSIVADRARSYRSVASPLDKSSN